MTRSYYSNTISDFLKDDETRILGQLSLHHNHALEDLQIFYSSYLIYRFKKEKNFGTSMKLTQKTNKTWGISS